MLRKIYKCASSLYVTIPLCIAVLFASCAKDEINHNSSGTPISEVAQNGYSGETLFRGIFFAEGEVASKISELQDLNVRNFLEGEELVKALHFQNKIIERINAENPGFFNEFKIAMKSRDHIKIQQELKKAGETVNMIFSDIINGHNNPETAKQVDVYKSELAAKLGNEIKDASQVSKAIKEVLKTAKDTKSADAADRAAFVIIFADTAIIAVQILFFALAIVNVVFLLSDVSLILPPAGVGNSLLKERVINSIATNI